MFTESSETAKVSESLSVSVFLAPGASSDTVTCCSLVMTPDVFCPFCSCVRSTVECRRYR